MPAIKARKVDASNMTTPVRVDQRVWNGSAYVWQTVMEDLFCEFRSMAATSVNTGMSTIGATKHMIYTRYQPPTNLAVGMRLYNYVTGTFAYIHNVTDVEQIHQWLEISAYEAILDTQVNILRTSETRGQYRHPSEAETPIATVGAIFAEPNAGVLAVVADRVGTLDFWAVGVPEDTDVQEGDYLEMVTTGQKFKVHSVRSPMSFKPLLTLLVGGQS